MDNDVTERIKAHFKTNDLPRPTTIRNAGRWAMGDLYAVTVGLEIIYQDDIKGENHE